MQKEMRRLIQLAAIACPLLCAHAQTGGNLSNCKGGCGMGERCVGNPFSQPVADSQCHKCAGGQYWWPCNFETLCYCNSVEEGAPRVPPAPKSRVKVNTELDPCRDILTEEVFNAIVQPTSEEGKMLYTYSGLCDAIAQYNAYHDEKFANMGNDEQLRGELAAFLAHAAVDTRGFSVTREEFHCVDPITGSDGRLYCKPCKEEDYNSETKTCARPYLALEESYKEYCDITRQDPQGCACSANNVKPVSVPVPTDAGIVDTSGYIDASEAYFTRGSIEISWNYDYYGASLSMTGDGSFLCDNPDLVATSPQYAWGAGIYKWMEKMTFGTQGETAHRQALLGNFGGTVEVLYGDLECPSNQWTSADHVNKVQERVAQACKAGAALGVYLEMEMEKRNCRSNTKKCLKCDGLKEIFELMYTVNPDCSTWSQFIRSEPPTVTPIRIESPTFDDWSLNYQERAEADMSSISWTGLTLSILFPFLVGVVPI